MGKFKPGISFGDFVIHDVMQRKSKVPEDAVRDFRRGWLVWLGVLMGLGLLAVKLIELQVFNGGRYGILADENRIKKIVLTAPRGVIFDRNGKELATNEESKKLSVDKLEIPVWKRIYPLKAMAAHVLGYVSEVSEDEVGLLKQAGQKYAAGDLTGRMGLEREYEPQLRGIDGGRLIEVDNTGTVVRELGTRKSVPGTDLKTTLDADLLGVANSAMGGKKGAVIVSIPKSGEILAINSSPSFDPNTLGVDYPILATTKDLPLFNRSIGGLYPPGSTFKMVTSIAGIDSGKVKQNFTYVDRGVIEVGSFRYTNWLFTKRGATEGAVGFVKALARSTDTFFYTVGEMTGPEVIAQWARNMGMGDKTQIDLPGEVGSLIGTPEWKKEARGEDWYLGDTYHMAIGQGDLLFTPLQVNVMTNVLATGGMLCRPHLLGVTPNSCRKVDISAQALKVDSDGMKQACEPGGTAFPLFDFKPRVACKTGTAEYIAENGKTRTHGWLTAYAPADNPTVSVTVVVEGGGEGSNVAAPVVRKILAKYFGVVDTYNYNAIPQEIGD